MNKLNLKPVLIFFILLLAGAVHVYAGGSPPPPPPPPTCWPPPCNAVPIDGGLGFLAAAAMAFGLKRLYDGRKSKG